MSETKLPPLTPELYGDASVREAHVMVVNRWAECANLSEDHPDKKLEFLHRQMNEEANVMENAASSLADFPDAPWEIRMWLARQCADEARHLLVYKQLVEGRGGHAGQFPVMNFQYRILQKIDTLIGRLAVQNRTFEAEGLDAVTHARAKAVAEGDYELAEIYDAQQADEIIHIGFANDWIHKQVKKNPRNVLRMAEALTRGGRAFEEVFAGGGTHVTEYGVAHAEREMAGFDTAEIEFASRQSDERRERVRAIEEQP